MVTWIVVLASSASAFNWNIGPPGPSFNYHVCDADFSGAEVSEIQAGGNAWDAGPGKVLRGAFVEVARDSDRSACSLGNGHDEVYMRDTQWLSNHFCGGSTTLACTLPGILLPDTDIIFNSDKVWCTSTPAGCAVNTRSIGQLFVHEFGHKIGFGHEDDVIASMNSSYPNGGDISATKYRIHEDDSVGLQEHKTDSSTGVNLMLARYTYLGDGDAEEVWVDDRTWDVSEGIFLFDDPEDILAIIEGTGSRTPLVEWRVEEEGAAACFDGEGTEYVVGTRSPGIAPNVPYAIGPTSWDFTGVPAPGHYKLCAKIDADDALSETAEGDNKVRSEGILTVWP